jgi:hypothetical protein
LSYLIKTRIALSLSRVDVTRGDEYEEVPQAYTDEEPRQSESDGRKFQAPASLLTAV